MADRLRQLLDLVSTAEPGTDGTSLAERAHFSRDHLDRLLAAATGEPPAALRRRLLLERAAWQLAHAATASEAARDAGYGSVAAFSRAGGFITPLETLMPLAPIVKTELDATESCAPTDGGHRAR